jgi:hypothetical protein
VLGTLVVKKKKKVHEENRDQMSFGVSNDRFSRIRKSCSEGEPFGLDPKE